MTDPTTVTKADIIARLDRQADAIRDLKARVKALESAAGATASTPTTVPDAAAPGVYVPRPTCLVCSKPKPSGRVELTCKPCGSERNRIIKTGGERPNYTECLNCGASKTGGMQMLCPPCSTSFREFKK